MIQDFKIHYWYVIVEHFEVTYNNQLMEVVDEWMLEGPDSLILHPCVMHSSNMGSRQLRKKVKVPKKSKGINK